MIQRRKIFMKNKLKYYKFSNTLTSFFLEESNFENAIYKFLKQLSKKTYVQRSSLFLFKNDLESMDNIYEYNKKGTSSLQREFQKIITKDFGWLMTELESNRMVSISNIDDLIAKAKQEKKFFEQHKIYAILALPLFIEKRLIGFIGLQNIKKPHKWNQRSYDYLELAGKVILKVLEKENYKKEISQVNATLQATLESTDTAIIVMKTNGIILNNNKKFVAMWNVRDEIMSKHNDIVLATAKNTLSSPSPKEFEERIRMTLSDPYESDHFTAYKKDGSIIKINSEALYVENKHIGRVWKCTDITKQKKYRNKLQLISKAFEKSNDAILITDKDINIIEINPAFEKITGFNLDEVKGKNPSFLQSHWHDKQFYKRLWKGITQDGYWEGELWDRRKNGETYINKTFITKIEHRSQVTNYIGISRDITQSKEYEKEIKQLAYYDALTNLPNRTFFQQNLENIIEECKRYEKKFALLFLDLDNFKYVNDTFGHLIGDKLLQLAARILEKSVRKSDIVARLGGDEFTIIIKDVKEMLGIDRIAKTIIQEIEKEIEIEGNSIHVGISIGICIYPDDAVLTDSLTKKADIAMYNSKNKGKNQYSYFNESMNEKITKHYEIEQSMRHSIAMDDFYIEYQPFVNTRKNTINTVEALVRWNHPSLGSIMPGEFIPIAEENGLIIKLGEWILERVFLDIKELQKDNIEKIAINISPKQLLSSGFFERVSFFVSRHRIDTSLLEFEITESIFINNSDIVLSNLHKLRRMGIRFALDDFGTGYSSLNYINKFSIETIKIDRSFIQSMCTNQNDMAIVNTILYLSKKLGKNIVVEGVETEQQLSYFKNRKKCQIQGFLFSKPLRLQLLKQMIAQR